MSLFKASEDELNPSPYKYRVSQAIKGIFLASFILCIAAYFYIVYQRRQVQNFFILENHMAALSWTPTPMQNFAVTEPLSMQNKELSASLGQWTLLNLWATWCAPCREEMPSLELLQQKLGDTLKVVALSLDDSEDPVIDFIKTNHPSFAVLLDKDKNSQKFFSINKFPETFLISPQGMIIAQFSGPRQWASPQAIDYLLRRMQ